MLLLLLFFIFFLITDALIDVDYLANGGEKIFQLANFLRSTIRSNTTTNDAIMASTAKSLGRLVKTQDGVMTSEVVEFEVKQALEWISEPNSRYEQRRQIGGLVLKELAESSPTTFFPYVATFLDGVRNPPTTTAALFRALSSILMRERARMNAHVLLLQMWVALRDQKQSIREVTAQALQSVLRIVSKREARLQEEWYGSVLAEANQVRLGLQYILLSLSLSLTHSLTHAYSLCRASKATRSNEFMARSWHSVNSFAARAPSFRTASRTCAIPSSSTRSIATSSSDAPSSR